MFTRARHEKMSGLVSEDLMVDWQPVLTLAFWDKPVTLGVIAGGIGVGFILAKKALAARRRRIALANDETAQPDYWMKRVEKAGKLPEGYKPKGGSIASNRSEGTAPS